MMSNNCSILTLPAILAVSGADHFAMGYRSINHHMRPL
jgi:hypothetical protein